MAGLTMNGRLKNLAEKFGAEKVLNFSPEAETGGGGWDIIYFKAAGDFEEIFALFRRSLKVGGAGSLWVLDSALPPSAEQWPEGFFKALFLIHDQCPDISYCTAADVASPYAILWRAAAAPDRRPYFQGPPEVRALDASCLPRLGGLLAPVTEELALSLPGASLAPALYLDPGHWSRLAAARRGCAARAEIERGLEELFVNNKPEQAEEMRRILKGD